MKKKNYILVTGCAGFIGHNLTLALLKSNYNVVGIDNVNNYYSKSLKNNRLKEIYNYKNSNHKNFIFYKLDLKNFIKLQMIFRKYKFKKIIHLAAQAGIRYSLINPRLYLNSNVLGFFNILECCKIYKIKKLLFASSSSVYGNLNKKKFKENDCTDKPIQFYAATKKSNEVMAHAYSTLYNFDCIGLRFFTVYGPWYRPDMSIFKFTKSIIENKKIEIFNKGKHERDFTYIDDVCTSVLRLLELKNHRQKKRFEIFNVGNSKPQKLINLIKIIEKILKKKAKKNYLQLQKGDVKKTFSDITKIYKRIKFKPNTDLKAGIEKFINWYKNYYKVI